MKQLCSGKPRLRPVPFVSVHLSFVFDMKDMMIIGVAGAGAMGRGIAQVAATAGHAVRLYDRDAGVLDEAMAFLRHIQDRSVTKGRIRSEDAAALLGRISTVSTVEDLGPCGLVVEAIVEREEVKKELFASLEAVVTPESVLASNTSSLSITALAAGLQHPRSFHWLAFFQPGSPAAFGGGGACIANAFRP